MRENDKSEKKSGTGLMARAAAINEALENESKTKETLETSSDAVTRAPSAPSERNPDVPKGKRPPKPHKHPKPHKTHNHEHKHHFVSRLLTKIIIILILLCSLVAGGLFYLQIMTKPVPVESKNMVIQEQLNYCQELVSIKYKYSDIVSLKKTAKIGPSKSYSIIKYSGVIRVGIADMSMCDYEVSEDGKTVKITLPDVIVLGNDISSQEVFDEQSSIFVPITLEEVFTEIEKSKEDVLEEIIQDGIITEAREHSKSVVRQFLLAAGFENVTVM